MADAAAPDPGPRLVLGRAAVLGTAGFGSGVASHVAGGGHLPGGLVLLSLLVVSVAVSANLLRTWASSRRLVITVLLAQSGWHLVLSLLAGHAGDPRTSTSARPLVLDDPGRRTGTLHDAYVASVPVPASGTGSSESVLSHQVQHLTEQGPAMVVAHLAGALVLGLVLARGEATVRMLVGVLDRTVERALGAGRAVPLHVAVAAPCPVTRLEPAHRAARLGRDSTRRRGPPVLLAA